MKRRLWLLPTTALLTAAALSTPNATAASLPTAASTASVSTSEELRDPVPVLTRAAKPVLSTEPAGGLADLRPLSRMVGDAAVVGIGEATHSSHEFFSLKHRAFCALVEHRGFTTFALEASWSTGLTLDRYVVSGVGDPREIMRREFQGSYEFWNNEEFLHLIEWMRAYNRTHKNKLHFIGDDLGYVGPETIDRVTSYISKTRPDLLPEFTRLYAGIRSDAEAGPWATAYWAKSLQERAKIEAAARQAVVRVESLPASAERTWALQHARAVWQVAKFYSLKIEDPAVLPEAMRFRDQVMAENVVWWTKTTGAKIVLSAHNGHIAYKSSMPEQYPKLQGEFIREDLGRRYVNVGLTFDRGSFNARETNDPEGKLRTFTIGSAPAGNNEHTLDRVPYRDYLVDLRTLPSHTRSWLKVARPTRDIGTGYPFPDLPTALADSYDLLIHLNQVTAAHLR